MSRYFTLYVIGDCRYCNDALELLSKNGEEYVTHDLSHSENQISEAKDKHGWNTFPIIYLNQSGEKKLIGGFDSLKDFYESNE